jgi:hypothetical protein
MSVMVHCHSKNITNRRPLVKFNFTKNPSGVPLALPVCAAVD